MDKVADQSFYNRLMEYQIQEIICPICMMIFKRPLTIACGHTFCYYCLNNALREHKSCPICRHEVTNNSNKIKVDQRIQQIADSYRRQMSKTDSQVNKQKIYTQCKAERLLLVDITTQDLLLPFNRITAVFELQSNTLIDRMERFVARQELPFNKYSIVCKLVHIEEVRKNLFKGVLQGYAFCTIETQEVESQMSLELDDEEFFYRTCKCKQISQTSQISPSEFNCFFQYFNKIDDNFKNKLIFTRIDPSIFLQRNDSVAIFYCILGIINLSNDSKYKIATLFEDQKRVNFIKEYLESNKVKIKSKPSSLVHIPAERGVNRMFLLLVLILLLFLYLKAQEL